VKGSLLQLLGSPRRRRRLARVAAALVVAGAAAFGTTLLTRNESPQTKEVFEPGKPVVTDNQKPVRLGKADRRAIGRTLVAFVRNGVAQQDLTAAYDLVTPAFRGGTTRAQWRKGASPVYVYPAVTRQISGNWRVDYAYRGQVGVAMMLSSTRPRKVGQIIFHGELRKRRSGWLVDSFAPVATFSPIGVGRQHETGPADYTGGSRAEVYSQKAALSTLWIVVPASVLALVLLVPLGFVLFSRVHDRRVARAHEATLPKTLPPLPTRRG
jgi:hypothetical protein